MRIPDIWKKGGGRSSEIERGILAAHQGEHQLCNGEVLEVGHQYQAAGALSITNAAEIKIYVKVCFC